MALRNQTGASDSRVSAFWEWFAIIAPELGAALDNEILLAELSIRIGQLGDLAWEVGPGDRADSALVISPDGSLELLARTRQVVQLAPFIPGWEFHAARPLRDWDLRYSVESAAGRMIPVDAREWSYVLLKFSDGTFDVILQQLNLVGVEEEVRYLAAIVLLDGLLGEIRRLEVIGGIEPVAKFLQEHVSKASPVTALSDHLDVLLRG